MREQASELVKSMTALTIANWHGAWSKMEPLFRNHRFRTVLFAARPAPKLNGTLFGTVRLGNRVPVGYIYVGSQPETRVYKIY